MPSSRAAPIDETYAAAFNAATTLHKAGNFAEAAARYEQLRDISPDDPQLLYLLGGAYVQLGRPRDAIGPIERSLALRPGNIPALDLAGSAWVAIGEPLRALPYFSESARDASASPSAIDRLAATLLRCGQPSEALTQYNRCRAIDPTSIAARLGSASALGALGRAAEAEDLLRSCAADDPKHANVHLALGMLLGQQERFAEAERHFRTAAEIAPAKAQAHYWLGVSLQKQSRAEEAIPAYASAHRLNPGDETTAIAMAEALIDAHRLDEAEAVLDKLASTTSHALTARGRIDERRGHLASAISIHDRAVAADPRNEAAYINRGNARRFSGDYEGALADYDAAIAIKPTAAAAVANRGLALLTLGRLREAWPYYYSRLRAHGSISDLTGGKPWDGSSLAGKRVLIWTEYGLGDEILFANMLPQVLGEAAQCTVVCAPRLVALFQRSFPTASVVPLGSPLPVDHDIHVGLTDLARRFRPDMHAFPPHQGYLRADQGRVDMLRGRYAGDRKVVGISWRSASGATGAFKSAPLEGWSELLSTSGVSFISLQYGNVSADIAGLREKTGIELKVDPTVDSSGDLDAFAAQVSAMDLVISVSNTTVHVAGALGKPTWILVPEGPGAHWYWFRDRADNPWYPSVRLFRQQRPGDWEAPLRAVTAALRTWVRS
jgi:tetratricopeptide (TPR) repeat protein